MLFDIIGDVVVAMLIPFCVFLYFTSKLDVPPKDLRRRWRSNR